MKKNEENLRPFHPDQTVILVAEDDVLIQNVVRVTLEGDGYFVLTAHDGQEALEISSRYLGHIHLLLTDYSMPRMNGLELSDEIRVRRPETKILLMSGYAPPRAAVPLLPKPFKMKELRELLSSMITQPVLLPPTMT